MAGSVPLIRGKGQAFYGTKRSLAYKTEVIQFVNGSEQRWKTRAPLNSFELPYDGLNKPDVSNQQNFVDSQKGEFDIAASLALGAATYENLTLEEDTYEIKEKDPTFYGSTFKLRQVQNRNIPTPVVNPVYPAFSVGLSAQLPYIRIRRFLTDKNDQATGMRYSWAWYGSGLSGFPDGALLAWTLEYLIMTDADLAILQEFFAGMNGRFGTFSFTDPDDGSAHPVCRFGTDSLDVTYTGPNQNHVTVSILEFNGVPAIPTGTPGTRTDIPVFATGVAADSTLAALGTTDLHWTLTSSADGAHPGPAAIVVSTPASSWVANPSDGQWIAPMADESAVHSNPSGHYVYQHTFDLTGFDPSTAIINGRWAADNHAILKLNGAVISSTPSPNAYAALTSFSITNGFVSGSNTLVIDCTNEPQPGDYSPTGILFAISSATAITAP